MFRFGLAVVLLGSLVVAEKSYVLQAGESVKSIADECSLSDIWKFKSPTSGNQFVNPFDVKPGDTILIPDDCMNPLPTAPDGWKVIKVHVLDTLEDLAVENMGDASLVSKLVTNVETKAVPTEPLTPGSVLYFPSNLFKEPTRKRPPRWLTYKVQDEAGMTLAAIAEEILGDPSAWRDLRTDKNKTSGIEGATADTVLPKDTYVYVFMHLDTVLPNQEFQRGWGKPQDGKPQIMEAAVDRDARRWPAKQSIPYFLDMSSLKSTDPAKIEGAIAHIMANTCVKFHKVSSSSGVVLRFFKDPEAVDYCWSWVGMRSTGGQVSSGCSMLTMVHEIGHALGLDHEQTRSDRDNYITINWAIFKTPGWEGWESEYEKANTDNSITPYDYASVMHYPNYEGEMVAKNDPTGAKTKLMGNYKGLSQWDMVAFNYLLGYAPACKPGGGGGSPTARPPTPTAPTRLPTRPPTAPTRATAPTRPPTRPPTAPTRPPTPRPTASCSDNANFKDFKGYSCGDWAGYNCKSYSGYTSAQSQAVVNNCPKSCGLCVVGRARAELEMACPETVQADFTKWPDVKKTCNCVVLVNNFQKNYNGKCSEYCSSVNMECAGAWDEIEDGCNKLSQLECDQAPEYVVDDALCQCMPKIDPNFVAPVNSASGLVPALAIPLVLSSLVLL